MTLGADQFDPKDPSQVEEKAKFFNYFYWAINLGATVSYGYLTHLALNGQAPSISEPWGFFASFLIPAVSFVIGIVVFVGGSPRYKHAPPSSSVLGEFGQIVYTAGKRSTQGMAFESDALTIQTNHTRITFEPRYGTAARIVFHDIGCSHRCHWVLCT